MGKVPEIDFTEELAEFWDEHDITDFEDELDEVRELIFDRSAGMEPDDV